MKLITREVKLYCYTFGKYDKATSTVVNPVNVRVCSPLTRAQKAEMCKSNGGLILIDSFETTEKFSMPVEMFILACEDYAKNYGPDTSAKTEDSEEDN